MNNRRFKVRQDLGISVYSNYSTASACLFVVIAVFIVLLVPLLCLMMN